MLNPLVWSGLEHQGAAEAPLRCNIPCIGQILPAMLEEAQTPRRWCIRPPSVPSFPHSGDWPERRRRADADDGHYTHNSLTVLHR